MTSYNADVIKWLTEQAAFIRAGRFDLLAHLIKWQYQPSHRGKSWARTIKNQRIMIVRRLNKTPSLKLELENADFWLESWADAARMADYETGILNIS